ncbi:pyridoxal phosphate-dependent decarboxylase family protein [Rhabdothermincola sediminis]|uniref:pyridoxal phosphate-dependent decarboxylase family protein n=1 Tax=Rhabdothermincola sediminis TaxID=2751370 RepID=UPI001AA06BFA|nr:aminotransferase class V-fold PLP-dependent enzyme [Rhabdothermincola sediminis]
MTDHPVPPEPTIKQFRERYETYAQLPPTGVPREEVLRVMREMAAEEQARWAEGYASGCVYNRDQDHIDFLIEAYAINSQSNPLHTDVWPSAVKYESEIVAMTASMLGGGHIGGGPGSPDGVCGTVSSGGSESIQLAMKTYRDYFRATKGITKPQMVVPETAHAAFDKSAQYFGIEIVHVPVGPDWRADVDAMADAVTDDTVVIVGSAPPFPHGIVDPIEELSEIARERGIGFHTDACLGGFVLPWAEKLGYDVPPFDFRLPGVTSISADTHKFGYAAKGTSVVLYRSQELRHYQYFTMTDWPGGLYCSPSFAGSRPGGLSAACWAAMVSIGEEGYLEATRRILETASTIKAGIEEMPELRLYGDPLFVIAFDSTDPALDIYRVNDAMTARGWALNPLHRPAALHLCVTQRHTQPGVAERFLGDLRAAIDWVRENPSSEGGMAPIYGMANTVPERGLVAEAMLDFMDGWYRLR